MHALKQKMLTCVAVSILCVFINYACFEKESVDMYCSTYLNVFIMYVASPDGPMAFEGTLKSKNSLVMCVTGWGGGGYIYHLTLQERERVGYVSHVSNEEGE